MNDPSLPDPLANVTSSAMAKKRSSDESLDPHVTSNNTSDVEAVQEPDRSTKRCRFDANDDAASDDHSADDALNAASPDKEDGLEKETDSQVDVGEVESQSASLLHQDFEEYNEETDEDWVAGASDSDNDSDGGSSCSGYEILPPHAEDTGDENFEQPWVSFTDQESEAIREDAKQLGLLKFIEKYVLTEHVPVLKLLEAFNVTMHPSAAMFATDLQLLPLLRTVVNRYLRKRRRLPHVNTIEDVVDLLQKANNIMIVTGAGVSVSCGIPDFRSETGIYSRLQDYDLDDPQQMFDIQYFRESPEIFYSFAKELYPANYEPSPSHMFVKLIEDKGKLLRNYTQNIDTLEHKAHIKRVVNCHGSFATASCVTCGYKCDGKDIETYINEQKVPPCPQCKANGTDTLGEEDDSLPRGRCVLKPDITFFGESLPPEFDRLLSVDTDLVDLLIVMGSSLKVSPVSEIMSQIPHHVPQILINRTPITHMTFDIQLLGNCDVIVPELCRKLGWDLRHAKLPGGSALSEESWALSRAPQGENGADGESQCGKMYTFWRDGLYTFPGAVVRERYLKREEENEIPAKPATNDDQGERSD